MSIVLVGVNHKSAPLAVRELLALSDDACASGLRSLVDGEVVREGLIVSTCNRVEVLTETATGRLNETTERIIQFLTRANELVEMFHEMHQWDVVNPAKGDEAALKLSQQPEISTLIEARREPP